MIFKSATCERELNLLTPYMNTTNAEKNTKDVFTQYTVGGGITASSPKNAMHIVIPTG